MGGLSFGKVDDQTVQYDPNDPEAPLEHVRPKKSSRHPDADVTIPHPKRGNLVIDLIFGRKK